MTLETESEKNDRRMTTEATMLSAVNHGLRKPAEIIDVSFVVGATIELAQETLFSLIDNGLVRMEAKAEIILTDKGEALIAEQVKKDIRIDQIGELAAKVRAIGSEVMASYNRSDA